MSFFVFYGIRTEWKKKLKLLRNDKKQEEMMS